MLATRVGYPAMNTSVGCTSAGTVRLVNLTKENLLTKISSNLDCLEKIIAYNREHNIQVYRLSSNLIPFASHENFPFDWQKEFKTRLANIGKEAGDMRLSLHPGQYVLINAVDKRIVDKSIDELLYQTALLDSMNAPQSAKVQIHVGGVYGKKIASTDRWIQNYKKLPESIKARLVIENDERLYTTEDCLTISSATKIPVLFDVFHHQIYPGELGVEQAFIRSRKTWRKKDGTQQIDYSQQGRGKNVGAHSQSINPIRFINEFYNHIKRDIGEGGLDIMLEVKDKEKSVQKVQKILNKV
jgi:UV DNA damage endonuclease